MYFCNDCEETFDDFKIVEYGTGAVLSKDEIAVCPMCDSENIKEL